MKILQLAVLLVSIVVMTACAPEKAEKTASVSSDLPVKDMVTLLELGSLTCLPCRMMMPIIAELEQEYKDRVAVRFINVNDEPDKAQAFAVMAIPTQIIFDRDGREVFRHVGFIAKDELAAEFQKYLKE